MAGEDKSIFPSAWEESEDFVKEEPYCGYCGTILDENGVCPAHPAESEENCEYCGKTLESDGMCPDGCSEDAEAESVTPFADGVRDQEQERASQDPEIFKKDFIVEDRDLGVMGKDFTVKDKPFDAEEEERLGNEAWIESETRRFSHLSLSHMAGVGNPRSSLVSRYDESKLPLETKNKIASMGLIRCAGNVFECPSSADFWKVTGGGKIVRLSNDVVNNNESIEAAPVDKPQAFLTSILDDLEF